MRITPCQYPCQPICIPTRVPELLCTWITTIFPKLVRILHHKSIFLRGWVPVMNVICTYSSDSPSCRSIFYPNTFNPSNGTRPTEMHPIFSELLFDNLWKTGLLFFVWKRGEKPGNWLQWPQSTVHWALARAPAPSALVRRFQLHLWSKCQRDRWNKTGLSLPRSRILE